MPNYRRMRVQGGTYFFTLRLADPKSSALIENMSLLRDAMRAEIRHHPFSLIETVILPNHLHAIWRLPEGDADFSNRWRRIKSSVTRKVVQSNSVSPSKKRKGEKGFWQRRFWEHSIRNDAELAHYRAYCWINPVKHGLVAHAQDWPYSSYHRALRRGEIDKDWQF
ncbi:MAG: transposase [Pseudomonadota bacterium]